MTKRIKQVPVSLAFAGFLLVCAFEGYGSDSLRNGLKKNIALVTFGGKENFGSINYERVFVTGGRLNLSYSVGGQLFQPSKKISLPFSINAFTKGRLHHVELDLTATFYMDKYHPYNGGWQDDYNKQLYITPFLCYRLQGSRGFVLKAGAGPQVLLDPPSDDAFRLNINSLPPAFFGSLGVSF